MTIGDGTFGLTRIYSTTCRGSAGPHLIALAAHAAAPRHRRKVAAFQAGGHRRRGQAGASRAAFFQSGRAGSAGATAPPAGAMQLDRPSSPSRIALAAGLGLAVWAGLPPRPLAGLRRAAALLGRARHARRRRPVPRAASGQARCEDAGARAQAGRAALRELGLESRSSRSPLSDKTHARLQAWRRRRRGDEGANLVGVLPGADRAAPAVLLMAHHDTVAGSPGRGRRSGRRRRHPGDGAGACSLSPARRRDLILLFTDAEETNSDGAETFFASPLAGRVGAVINLEARGGGGRAR